MTSNQFDMTVCVNGRPIREYGHRGLTFVEGRKNQPYTIKFRNNSARRVLAVISVDGVSAVDGKPADNDSRGYIIPAYASAEIKGWRTSKRETHKFVFDTKTKAYSTQGQKEDTNCGVVAVKVFDEKITLAQLNSILRVVSEEHHHHHYPAPRVVPDPYGPPWVQPVIWGSNGAPMTVGTGTTYGCNTTVNNASLGGQVKAASCACESLNLLPDDPPPLMDFSAAVAPKEQENPDFNLGTGWGAAQVDEVEEDKFDRGLELACFSIFYSDSEGLKAAGIEVDKKPAVSSPVLPRGFNGFCKPPVVTST